MESIFWRRIKSRFLGPLRRIKNLRRKQHEYFQRLSEATSVSDLVIDAGANIGEITSFILSLKKSNFQELWAFEPDTQAFSRLDLIQDPRLKKFNEALWEDDGTAKLYRHKSWLKNQSHTSSSLIRTKSNVDDMNSICIRKTDLARIIDESTFKSITIKMDVEGAEYRLIHHLISTGTISKIKYIFCEFHPNSLRYGYSLHAYLKWRLLVTGNFGKIKTWI